MRLPVVITALGLLCSAALGQGLSGDALRDDIDFVRKKVYRRYAELFLDKEQIDEVDESKIPGYTP